MIKAYQIDGELALVKWENLEDAKLLVGFLQEHDIPIKSIAKELWD